MLSGVSQSGFTLIELMVGITIAGILLALGVPAMGTYWHNSKLNASAQSLHAGLEVARSVAVQRNGGVDFVMTNDSIAASGIQNTVSPAASGINWLVRALNTSGTYDLIDAKAGGEGEGQTTPTIQIAVSASAPFAGTLTFNGVGGIANGQPYVFDVTDPGAGTCVAAGGQMRCRRIRVSGGGQMFSCDPAVTDPADNRYCR